jgi:hypothetical protein
MAQCALKRIMILLCMEGGQSLRCLVGARSLARDTGERCTLLITAGGVTGSAARGITMTTRQKYTKGEHVIFDDRRIAKVVEPETEAGNARIAYYDALGGENVRLWVDVSALRRVV